MKNMLGSFFVFLVFSFLLFPWLSIAQDAATVVAAGTEVIAPPTVDDLQLFLNSLGNVKGLGTLGVVAVLVQGLMIFLKTGLGQLAGKYQLVLVLLLTLVGGVIALKSQGLGWGSVLIHSSTIAAVQVFLHQIYKQFVEKANEAPK